MYFYRVEALKRVLFLVLATALVVGAGAGAAQAKKSKSTKTEATFIAYDAEAKTLEVKVKKKGKKPANKKLKLKTGKSATFKVKPEGSVLTRTSVTLDGKRAEAAAAVPDALVDEVALVGPRERIAERLSAWKAAAGKGQVDTLVVGGATPEVLRLLAEEVL